MTNNISIFESILYKYFNNFHQNYYMEYKCDSYRYNYKFSFTKCFISYIKNEFFK